MWRYGGEGGGEEGEERCGGMEVRVGVRRVWR